MRRPRPAKPVRPVAAETPAGALAEVAPSNRALLQLQGVAGNAAVSALLAAGGSGRALLQRRSAGGTIPPPPVPPRAPAPAEHPGFRATKAKITAAKRQAAKHPPARAKAAEAGRAAKPPADDKEAQAKQAKAADMAAAPAGGFDKAAFIAAVTAAIAKQAPKNLEEADNFASSGKSDAVAAEVKGKVGQSKEASAKPMAEASEKAPDTSKAQQKPVTPLPPPPPAAALPAVDGKAAMPAKAPAEQTELGNGPAETGQKMADAEVTEEQLAKSNEPEFTGALAAKKEGEQHSATAPAAFRAGEAQQLATAQQGAQVAGVQGAAGMLTARGAAMQQLGGAQQRTQTKDETKRAEITTKIKGIFDATKTAVDAILAGIDPQVDKQFTDGERQAKAAFTAHHKARMDKYKDDRYSGLLGAGRWIKDKFADLPSEVNQFYVEAKQIYENQMKGVISGIADTVGRELTRAKDRIGQGRKEISTYVSQLDPALRAVGQAAATEIGSQFDTLTESVDEKSQSLAEDLAEKYVAARNAVDEEIKALQEENKGLWSKAKDAIGGAIETILKLKNLLMGALARAAGAISKIIKDPIGFLGNFVNAVKSGVMNFGSNILTHLKKGLQSWLFGTLAEAGIEIPEKFDLKGIVGLILSMLGLTWASIRARLAKVLPEWVLKALETAVEVVKILSTEGVSGLWTWIVGKITDLKEQVMGQIKDFVITKIITAGITWLISLLNPAAAFIKACKMIYDAVMWFVDNAERMSDFVSSVLDSVESIASGGVGKVAGMIEATLGKAIPMVISGLASLLGLGGIADKIKKILESVQKPVGKVVDGIIGGVVKYGKKMLGKLKKKKDKKDLSPEERQKQLDHGLHDLSQLTQRYRSRGIGEEQLRSNLNAIKNKHPVFTELSPVKHGANWDYVYVARTVVGGPPAGGGGTFSHAPGGMIAHEGTTVVMGKKGPKTIHLLRKHGETVTDVMLIDRLKAALTIFTDVRQDKIKAQQAIVKTATATLNGLSARPATPERDDGITKANKRLSEALALIAGYNAIGLDDRDAVFAALDKWSKNLPHMVSKEVTHFTDNKILESEAAAAFVAKKAAINAAFTQPDGSSKPKGSTFVVTHPAPSGLGEGYEMDPKNVAVKITAPLTKIVFRLILSDETARHFMVETAYFEK